MLSWVKGKLQGIVLQMYLPGKASMKNMAERYGVVQYNLHVQDMLMH